MKKLLYLALTLLLVLALCACGGGETAGNTTGKPAGTTAGSTIDVTTHSHHFDETSGLCSCGLKASKGLDFELNDNGKSYKVTGIGDCADTDVVIPDTYNGLPVTYIGENAFYFCPELTSILISNTVTNIYKSAFAYCDKLKSVNIPNSVTCIGESVFYGCDSLDSIYIPGSVTDIGNNVFQSCDNLRSITVAKENVVYHSEGNCLIKTASKTLVAGCKTSVIPTDGSVTSIGDSAFYVSKLTSIVIPDGVTNIGEHAFQGSDLTELVIPDSVTSIGKYAFKNCFELTSVTIGKGVTNISGWAFDTCEKLKTVNIPNSVTEIGEKAFGRCRTLKTINFNGTKRQWKSIDKHYFWDDDAGDYTIMCTDGEYCALTVSTTSVNLSPTNDFYQVIDITCTYSTIYWYTADTSIVSCKWGNFENGECQLYITGKGVGTIPVYVFCSDDDNLDADDWASAAEYIPITVNVDISDSNEYVKLYNDDNGKYVTDQSYSYTGLTVTKSELVMSDNSSAGVRFRVRKNSDNTVTFISEDGKYLYCDGTNVKWSTVENQFYTRYRVIITTDGYYIKCASVTYNGKSQYLEVYSGYLTCYSYGAADDSQYVFKFVS